VPVKENSTKSRPQGKQIVPGHLKMRLVMSCPCGKSGELEVIGYSTPVRRCLSCKSEMLVIHQERVEE